MGSKTFFLLLLLIAGTIATEDFDTDASLVEREDEPEMDFDAEAEDAEDYDEEDEGEVEEDERNLAEDMKKLDKDEMEDVKVFCADAKNADDPVCKIKM